MTTDKLPPLAEVLRDRAESFSRTAMYVDPLPEGRLWRARRDEARAAAEYAAPYDAELARLREENAELEEFAERRRHEAWSWMQVANERGERIAELEAELAKFRELAREAHEMNRRSTIGVYEVTRVFHSLAALHKEE